MALVVVGGHSRDVGKTSVVAGLIAATREYDWLAMKITQYGHGVCSANGEPCDCVTADHSMAITEERDPDGESDTSRILGAGAKRVLWVRTQQGLLAEAMPRVRSEISKAQHVIIESNSVMRFVKPSLYIVVLDPAQSDFKSSSREFLDRADVLLLRRREQVGWENVSLKPAARALQIAFTPPDYVPSQLTQLLRREVQRAA